VTRQNIQYKFTTRLSKQSGAGTFQGIVQLPEGLVAVRAVVRIPDGTHTSGRCPVFDETLHGSRHVEGLGSEEGAMCLDEEAAVDLIIRAMIRS
jgi:hypothetical protein